MKPNSSYDWKPLTHVRFINKIACDPYQKNDNYKDVYDFPYKLKAFRYTMYMALQSRKKTNDRFNNPV